MGFSIENCKIDGLKIIHPFYVEDERGFFLKSFEQDIFASFGLDNVISEDFESFSYKNVIRGMHFQVHNPQIKMVRAITGKIMDVAVDLRKDSPAFGEWESVILSEENHDVFWIPAGFAHGFRVLTDNAIVSYKCVGKYDKETDTGIRWNDEDISIDWGMDEARAIVSEKDKMLMSFDDFRDKYKYLKDYVNSHGGGYNPAFIIYMLIANFTYGGLAYE